MLREFVAAKSRLWLWFAAGAVLFSTNAFAQHFVQTNLVSNNNVMGTKPDPNLVNAWGVSRSWRTRTHAPVR